MNNPEILMSWLKDTEIPLSVISRETGISRKTLYNWQNGTTPTVKSIGRLSDYYNKSQISVKVTKEGGIDKDYVIELQKEKIKSLEAQNEKKEMEKSIWEMLDYNAEFGVELKFEGLRLKRRIVSATGIKLLSEALGYSVDEIKRDFYCLGEWYEMKKHPIDMIMSKETISSLKHYTDNFPTLFKAYKSIVGDHYIPFNITYIGRNGKTVQASVYNRVHWRELRVESKVNMFV